MFWKPGDIGIIIQTGKVIEYAHCVGREFTVLRPCTLRGPGWWYIDLQGEGEMWAYEECMRPLPPPNEVTSWEDSVWKPKELIHV